MRSLPFKKSVSIAALAASSMLFTLAARAQSVPISSVYSGGAGTYEVTGTVTSILNSTGTVNTFTVTDNSGSILTYAVSKTAYTANVGDNITFTTTNSPYQGSPEFTSTGFTLNSTNSTGNAVSPAVLTIPQFVAAGDGRAAANPPFAEALVTLNNVYLPTGTTTIGTKTTYVLSDGLGNSTNMYTYTTDSAVAAAVTAANSAETASGGTLYSGPLTITGYADVYYGVPEIYPTSIVASAAPEPSTYALMGVGGLALVLLSRRARRA